MKGIQDILIKTKRLVYEKQADDKKILQSVLKVLSLDYEDEANEKAYIAAIDFIGTKSNKLVVRTRNKSLSNYIYSRKDVILCSLKKDGFVLDGIVVY
ncbi:MAG: hypothetical protein CEN90_491 [Parcubacteria group bacterium Licking1014_17]|nr:MAG: hypothetical protein CEN90_491 [Parcubacteria group bacterium Licking1014_17]